MSAGTSTSTITSTGTGTGTSCGTGTGISTSTSTRTNHVNSSRYFDVDSALTISTYVYVLFDGRNYGAFHLGTTLTIAAAAAAADARFHKPNAAFDCGTLLRFSAV
jgi:carbohydrate-binding DOMON domain-containing protein